jgi:hypothetical protein
MAKPPTDRFDTIPADIERTGAHRGPRRKGRGWIAFAWAALATGIIVAGGVIGLAVINNNLKFSEILGGSTVATEAPAPTPTPAPTTAITPIVDPALAVTVLNGTETVGLAASIGEAMREAGWDGIGSTANASATDFKTTTVYYVDPANEAAALGLADSLFAKATTDAEANGVALSITSVRVEQSDQFQGADLTVVLGSDFLEPSADGTTDEPVE